MGGISGAPVFVRGTHSVPANNEALPTQPGTVASLADYMLLGVAHGHWKIPKDEINEPHHSLAQGELNVGIAVVTPAFKLLETLNHPELVKRREEEVERRTKGGQGTPRPRGRR
jgi:hypothetical protein